MGEQSTGRLSGISTTKEDGYGEKVAKSVPLAGGLVKGGDNAIGNFADGPQQSDFEALAADGTSFIQSCTDAAAGIAADPLGWLIEQGLNFLLTLVQPLQDLLHMVTGDGPALANGAANFSQIAKGLEKKAAEVKSETDQQLAQWHGEAADLARSKFGKLAEGANATAAQAGNISQLLQISSMIMTVIEEFIKALITELVEWLALIWIPALAAAIPTAGASTAAATAGTVAKGAHTASKATKQVSRLKKLLDMISELITKLKTFFQKLGPQLKKELGEMKSTGVDAARKTQGAAAGKGGAPSTAEKFEGHQGARGKRVTDGYRKSRDDELLFNSAGDPKGTGGLGKAFANRAYTAGKDSLAGQVGSGKVATHLNNVTKAGRSGETGDEESQEEARDDLDF